MTSDDLARALNLPRAAAKLLAAELRNAMTPAHCAAQLIDNAEDAAAVRDTVERVLKIARAVSERADEPQWDDDCEQTFICSRCLRVVPWEQGAADSFPDLCDDCWTAAMGRRSGVQDDRVSEEKEEEPLCSRDPLDAEPPDADRECPDCDGSGEMERHMYGGRSEFTEMVDCEWCHGTGRIEP